MNSQKIIINTLNMGTKDNKPVDRSPVVMQLDNQEIILSNKDQLSFADVINSGKLNIDKSLFIKDLIDNFNVPAQALIYPTACGKSFILSMLQHFFSHSVQGKNTQELFSQLQIS